VISFWCPPVKGRESYVSTRRRTKVIYEQLTASGDRHIVHFAILFLDNSRPADDDCLLVLIHWPVLVGKLIVASLNLSPFVQPEGQLSCPRKPAICRCPEPRESGVYSQTTLIYFTDNLVVFVWVYMRSLSFRFLDSKNYVGVWHMSLIWPFVLWLVKSTNNESRRYTVSSSVRVPPLCCAQVNSRLFIGSRPLLLALGDAPGFKPMRK
jgi:hypothetical protein